MIEIAYEPSSHLLCSIAAGVRSSADNEQLFAAIDELDRHGVVHQHSVAVALELAHGSEPLDAYWRRRFAVQRQGMKAPRAFHAVITTSKVLRGVLTAINWIGPTPPHVKSVHHGTRQEAAAWLEIVHGAPVDETLDLFARISWPVAKAR
jgi:hypothetical protein